MGGWGIGNGLGLSLDVGLIELAMYPVFVAEMILRNEFDDVTVFGDRNSDTCLSASPQQHLTGEFR